MSVRLAKSGYHLEDWFYIEVDGESFTPNIEGTGAEWLAMLCYISKRKECVFRRCAVSPVNGGLRMWSPRNAEEAWDHLYVEDCEIPELTKSIREALGKEYGYEQERGKRD